MKNKPNILLIVSDQHRYDCTGFSGQYPVKTPNIDRLAAEGMWFSNAYTPIPICCPSRQCLLNGRRPESFGALWNFDNSLPTGALKPTEYAWPRDLKRVGYRTGFVGKWHVNPEFGPSEYGYDDWVGEHEYAAFRKEKYPEGSIRSDWKGQLDTVPLEDSSTHWLAARTIEMIRRYARTGEPWHIQLDFPQPHLPCCPSEEFASLYDPEQVPAWGGFQDNLRNKPYIQRQQRVNWEVEGMTWPEWQPVAARYYAIISQMDEAIGRVVRSLKELGLDEDTVVIYTSDHGDMCGSHGMVDKHYILYDDVVRVPLAVRWPSVIRAGARCEAFVYQFMDLAPTLLEIAGIEQPDFFCGNSLLPLFQERMPACWRKEAVSTYNGQQFGLYTQRMIRNERWKYIWNTTDVDELYDMQTDPYELQNRIGDESLKDVLKELRNRLYTVLAAEGDGLVASSWLKRQLCEGKKL